MLLPALAGVIGLVADAPVPPAPASSPVAELVTVTCAGVAAIIVALGGYGSMRKRRQAEADAAPVPVLSDPEDRSSRLRERLTALETRATGHDREIADLKEALALRRAADIVYEAQAAPRRRRRPEVTE